MSVSSDDGYLYILKLPENHNPTVNSTRIANNYKMIIDTGASINVIDGDTFRRLWNIK